MITVMVTGVGAIIGYGILRSLRSAYGNTIRLVGTDIYSDAVGQVWCDHFVQAPLTAEPHYNSWLMDVIQTYQVTLLIPGIEQDIHHFATSVEFIAALPCTVVLNENALIELSHDKWKTHEALREIQNEMRIPSYLEGSFDFLADRCGVPFLLKPRIGYASKGIVRIGNTEEFEIYSKKLGKTYMAQPIIGTDDQEYTVSAFCNKKGHILASISFLRRLATDGSTAKVWVKSHDDLNRQITHLCDIFTPVGPTNFQVRRDGQGWKLLEINPRISSSTSLRTAFGYNEAEMCVRYFAEGEIIQQPEIRSGFAVRYVEDYIIYDRDHF